MNAHAGYSESATCPALPNGPVFNMIEENNKRLAELEDGLSKLGHKIAPILRPEPVMMQTGKNSAEAGKVESELVSQLRSQGTALSLLIQQVVQMHERSEV